MREIRVEFAATRPTPAWFTVTALTILIPLIGWQAWHVMELNAELQRSRESKAIIERQIEQARAQRKEAEDRAREAAQTPEARSLAAIRSFPLDDVLTSVETARMDGVRLMALDIAAADGTVRLECEYVNLEKILQYVAKLNEISAHLRWQLLSARANPAGGSAAGSAVVVAIRTDGKNAASPPGERAPASPTN
jgi:hypothetical protein